MKAVLATPGTLERVPVPGVDQRLEPAEVRIFLRIDVPVLACFRMSVIEDHHPGAKVAVRIDSFISAQAQFWIPLHAGGRPPEAAAPFKVRFRHGIADQQILRRTDNGGPFEPRSGGEFDSADAQIIPIVIGMNAKKVAIVSVADQMTVELPLPLDAVVGALSFEARAMKEIRESIGRVSDDCGPPPIRQRSCFIGVIKSEVIITMTREDVAVLFGVKLHEQADLPQVVQTCDSFPFRLGSREGWQQQP